MRLGARIRPEIIRGYLIFIMNDNGLKKRSEERRKRMVGNYARSFKEAEAWDLQFWQSQTPEMRLSALVAIRNDIMAVRGNDPDFSWEDD